MPTDWGPRSGTPSRTWRSTSAGCSSPTKRSPSSMISWRASLLRRTLLRSTASPRRGSGQRSGKSRGLSARAGSGRSPRAVGMNARAMTDPTTWPPVSPPPGGRRAACHDRTSHSSPPSSSEPRSTGRGRPERRPACRDVTLTLGRVGMGFERHRSSDPNRGLPPIPTDPTSPTADPCNNPLAWLGALILGEYPVENYHGPAHR